MRDRRGYARLGFVIGLVILASLCVAFVVGAQGGTEARLISGEVVSLAGCLMKGHMGADKADVGRFDTADRGLPIGILDPEEDRIYLATYRGGNAAPKLSELMGRKVNAQGPVYSRHGVYLIDIQVLSEQ